MKNFFEHYRATLGYIVIVGMLAYILFIQALDRQASRCAIVAAFDTYTTVLIQAAQLNDEEPPTDKELTEMKDAQKFIGMQIRKELAPLHPEAC